MGSRAQKVCAGGQVSAPKKPGMYSLPPFSGHWYQYVAWSNWPLMATCRYVGMAQLVR